MPTPKKGFRLGKSPSHQRKILSNLAASLIMEERLTTTSAKAKMLRPYVEKIVTKARRGDLHARRNGTVPGRLLQYLDQAKIERELRAHSERPDEQLIARESREQLRESLERLPNLDRQVLAMHYERRWTARTIARRMRLPNQRKVYTIVERALRRLRRNGGAKHD